MHATSRYTGAATCSSASPVGFGPLGIRAEKLTATIAGEVPRRGARGACLTQSQLEESARGAGCGRGYRPSGCRTALNVGEYEADGVAIRSTPPPPPHGPALAAGFVELTIQIDDHVAVLGLPPSRS